MIALDTDVLVRLLVEDDEDQTSRARDLVEQLQTEDATAWVSDVVICELVWVLSRSYDVERSDICDLIDALLRARHLTFKDSSQLRQALDRFRKSRGDFADYVIQVDAMEAGCSEVATFDRALLKEEGFFKP